MTWRTSFLSGRPIARYVPSALCASRTRPRARRRRRASTQRPATADEASGEGDPEGARKPQRASIEAPTDQPASRTDLASIEARCPCHRVTAERRGEPI
jgi:hypothetical protein